MDSQASGNSRGAVVTGWVAVGFSILVSCLWAMWGTFEAFHEGWWDASLGGRLLQTLAYLSFAVFTSALSLVAIRWPRAGAGVYFLFGSAFTFLIFKERWHNLDWMVILSWLPVTGLLIVIAGCYWFARIRQRRLMYWLAVVLPVLTVVCCGAGGAWRVATRVDDGIRTERLVEGNGVALVWAPEGPGWVMDARSCTGWDEAVEICDHLSADGQTVCDEPQHIWRLPTIDEAVRSMARHGQNCGGVWDAETGRASYQVRPDKESPLWVPFSETIYWWTATEIDEDYAWIIVYDGKAWKKRKDRRMGSQGFRAVREP